MASPAELDYWLLVPAVGLEPTPLQGLSLLPLHWATPANWLVPRDSNLDSHKENSVLQTGATNRIRLTPELWPRAWESNPVTPFPTFGALAVRWLTIRLALGGTGPGIRTLQ